VNGGSARLWDAGSSDRTHSRPLRSGSDVGNVPSICAGHSMLCPYGVREIDGFLPSGGESQESRRDAGAVKGNTAPYVKG